MALTPLQTAATLFAVSLGGALLPLHRRWSERGLHAFVGVAAGMFLGTVFLHLFPHLAATGSAARGSASDLAPWAAALTGLLLLFVAERVWLPWTSGPKAADPHRALWLATWVGLGMHSLAEGIALPAILDDAEVRAQFLLSILVHKATEAFSLATVMRLARLGAARSAALLVAFAMISPFGILLGGQIAQHGAGLDRVLTGFACGTFLYVAACDLLPEVFHEVDRPLWKLLAVGVGVLATAVT